jgi:hypothetical protein
VSLVSPFFYYAISEIFLNSVVSLAASIPWWILCSIGSGYILDFLFSGSVLLPLNFWLSLACRAGLAVCTLCFFLLISHSLFGSLCSLLNSWFSSIPRESCSHMPALLFPIHFCFRVVPCSPVLFLNCWIEKLKVLLFKLVTYGDFLNTPSRCSVKCLWGYRLFFDLIFVINLARSFTGIDLCFRCGS